MIVVLSLQAWFSHISIVSLGWEWDCTSVICLIIYVTWCIDLARKSLRRCLSSDTTHLNIVCRLILHLSVVWRIPTIVCILIILLMWRTPTRDRLKLPPTVYLLVSLWVHWWYYATWNILTNFVMITRLLVLLNLVILFGLARFPHYNVLWWIYVILVYISIVHVISKLYVLYFPIDMCLLSYGFLSIL